MSSGSYWYVGGVWWSFYRKRSVVAYYAAVRAVERTGGSYSEVAAARPKGWWRRNWKWFVLAYLAFVVILVLVVEVSLRRSDPYTGAMRLANADPQVVAALGTPVEAGMLLTGEIESSVSAKRVSGHASFQIPLHGPRGSGELSVAALRDSSGWKYTRMIFRAKGRSDTLVWAPAASGRADTTSAR